MSQGLSEKRLSSSPPSARVHAAFISRASIERHPRRSAIVGMGISQARRSRPPGRRGWLPAGRCCRNRSRTLGFILVEVLVVMAVVSLLICILLPSVSKAKQMAKEVIDEANWRNFMFRDFFEGRQPGEYPRGECGRYHDGAFEENWRNLYSGVSAAVSSADCYQDYSDRGNQCFQLRGGGNWSRTDLVRVGPFCDSLTWEVAIKFVSGRSVFVGTVVPHNGDLDRPSNMNRQYNGVYLNGITKRLSWSESGEAIAEPIDPNRWYKVRTIMDFKAEKADVYLGWELKLKGAPLKPRRFRASSGSQELWYELDNVALHTSSQNNTAVCFDGFRISEGKIVPPK